MKLKAGITVSIVLLGGAIISTGLGLRTQSTTPNAGEVIGGYQYTIKRGAAATTTEVKYAYVSGAMDERLPTISGKQPAREDVSRRTKSSRTFVQNDGTMATQIVGGLPQYYKDRAGGWWQAGYATATVSSYQSLPKIPDYNGTSTAWLIPVAYAQTTFYPEPNPETSVFDGYHEFGPGAGGGTWDRSRNNATSTLRDDSGTLILVGSLRNGADNGNQLRRGLLGFDTSSIPDTDTITAATLSLYATSTELDQDNDGNDFIGITKISPYATSTGFQTTDFDNYFDLATTSGASSTLTEMHNSSERKDLGVITAGNYIDFAFNATGLAEISKTGETWFGINEGHDILDDGLAAALISSQGNEERFSTSEVGGTDQDPKLVVTHSAAASGTTPPQVYLFE